jgi:hypothetical protein
LQLRWTRTVCVREWRRTGFDPVLLPPVAILDWAASILSHFLLGWYVAWHQNREVVTWHEGFNFESDSKRTGRYKTYVWSILVAKCDSDTGLSSHAQIDYVSCELDRTTWQHLNWGDALWIKTVDFLICTSNPFRNHIPNFFERGSNQTRMAFFCLRKLFQLTQNYFSNVWMRAKAMQSMRQ